jgi:hypothetical protein
MEIRSRGTMEHIHWTKFLEHQFQDLEMISIVSYKDYVACEIAQAGYNKS